MSSEKFHMNHQTDDMKEFQKLLRKVASGFKPLHSRKRLLQKKDLHLLSSQLKLAEVIFPEKVIIIYDRSGNQIYFSHNMRSVMGYASDVLLKLPGNVLYSLIHPDDLKALRSCFQKVHQSFTVLRKSRPVFSVRVNFRFQKAGGRYSHVAYETMVIESCSLLVHLATLSDISRVRAFNSVELVVREKRNGLVFDLAHYKASEQHGEVVPRKEFISRATMFLN